MKKKIINLLVNLGLLIFILAAATGMGLLFRLIKLHETNVVIIYIFSVFLIARFTKGYIFGIIGSVISFLLYNLFFTEPVMTLKVDDPLYWITFIIMTFTSVFTSMLTTKVKKSADDAKIRENESTALYKLINHLSDAEGKQAIGEITVKTIYQVLSCQAAIIYINEQGDPEKNFIQCTDKGEIKIRELYNGNELKESLYQLHENVLITDNYYVYPIYGNSSVLGVVSIPHENGSEMTSAQNRMLYSIIENISISLDRLRSLEEQVKSREETTQERYRANLLRAISHDIRTPLSAIIGTSEMLMKQNEQNQDSYNLANDIYKDAQWLHGLVENILNLTKLYDGKMILKKNAEALEEVIGVALMVVEKRINNRVIDIQMPDSVVMVSIDAKLISQVIVNLLENAIKYTPDDKQIAIIVKIENDFVNVTVEDHGIGIKDEDLPHIFKMFFTSQNKIPDANRGVGLGLAICQSIVEAHGGKITAKNREGGGASFTFTLPIGGQNNG